MKKRMNNTLLAEILGQHPLHIRRLRIGVCLPRPDKALLLADSLGIQPFHFMWPERYGNPWPVIEAHWPEVEAYLKARISGESPDLPRCLATFGHQPETE